MFPLYPGHSQKCFWHTSNVQLYKNRRTLPFLLYLNETRPSNNWTQPFVQAYKFWKIMTQYCWHLYKVLWMIIFWFIRVFLYFSSLIYFQIWWLLLSYKPLILLLYNFSKTSWKDFLFQTWTLLYLASEKTFPNNIEKMWDVQLIP